MRQAIIYLRVSTIEQTTANQERELREIASRSRARAREIIEFFRLGAPVRNDQGRY